MTATSLTCTVCDTADLTAFAFLGLIHRSLDRFDAIFPTKRPFLASAGLVATCDAILRADCLCEGSTVILFGVVKDCPPVANIAAKTTKAATARVETRMLSLHKLHMHLRPNTVSNCASFPF